MQAAGGQSATHAEDRSSVPQCHPFAGGDRDIVCALREDRRDICVSTVTTSRDGEVMRGDDR